MSADSTPTEVFEDIDPDPDAVLAEFGVESPDDLAADGGAHDPVPDDEIDADDTTAAELFADLEVQYREESALEDRESDDGATDSADDSTDAIDGEFPPEFEEFEAAFVGDPGTTVREDDDGLVESTAAELNAVADRVFSSDGTTAVDDAGETDEAVATTDSGESRPAISETTDADEDEAGTRTETAARDLDGADARDPDGTDARAVARSDDEFVSDRTLTVSDGTADDLELVGPDPTATRVDNEVFGSAVADRR